jgi:hypothetical protein
VPERTSKITPITRRRILDELTLSGQPYSGDLDEVEFLGRVYDLAKLPTTDYRAREFPDAAADIWQHRINNPYDWPDNWVWTDSRFKLSGSDQEYLRFLCEMLHPMVPRNPAEVERLLQPFNAALREDGWELVSIERISGRPVFGYQRAAKPSTRSYQYDVAISFAGSERKLAEDLSELVRQAGFRVCYDDFYPDQLWGKELPVFFDEIYRQKSRYCVIFMSEEYRDRMWTSHERKSALARALEDRGREYILPIEVDATELPGLPPTIGRVSLRKYSIKETARMLIRKLEA